MLNENEDEAIVMKSRSDAIVTFGIASVLLRDNEA
jgi:hypothetical protein